MIDPKDFFQHVDLSHLHDKICKFRELDFKKMSYPDVQNAIMDVISFNTPHGNQSILSVQNSQLQPGTRFYRVRNLSEDDRKLPLRDMSKISDCWKAPEKYVQAGRLNKDKESLLYTAPLFPGVAVEEMKIQDDTLFSLIVYESIYPINFTIIGGSPNTEGLSSEDALKSRMIQDFLKHEFTRDVGKGTEYLYRISESITKDYFDLPQEFQDAWCYPSVAQKGAFNICFRKESKLKLIGVQIASVTRINNGYTFTVKIIATDSGDGVNLQYHEIGSDAQKNIFPELSPITI